MSTHQPERNGLNGTITLALIKPQAILRGYVPGILQMIKERGFSVLATRQLTLSEEQAADFYEEHANNYYFEPLVEYMTSGPVMAVLLQKSQAVTTFRELIGRTDPAEAAEGTIRKKYGTTTRYNAIHGSDSDQRARWEAEFFFAPLERYLLPLDVPTAASH